ncbi:NAD(P)H-hydrate dehydratase [Beijerinckia sp. L45]|uniref:NAD(P)H-hydrate dehydratase n=1 Tax=Beijerinckia sp. L45 TaxID=1641855 RepID=UPI00131D929E|nr:NAD(P)H-hydrate dehydratase [Beijerinckia sp. L45]
MTLTAAEIPLRRQGFPVELLLPSEMAAVDRLAGQIGQSGAVLMERAGQAIAQAAVRLIGEHVPNAHVAVLCGPGNNGGDGFVAARLLAQRGLIVTVGLLGERLALKGDAAGAAGLWTGPVTALADIAFDDADLVIDALFGAGLARDIDGPAKAAIARLNAWAKADGKPVLAVDIPSGVDGASGTVRGIAVEATACITFFRLKPGHFLMPGRLRRGSLSLADIGLDPHLLATIHPQAMLNAPALWASRMPVPSLAGHKYQRGHAIVVSGPMAQTGAARLAARGALRAGAGLVTIATPLDALAVHASVLNAIMTRVCDSPDDLEDMLTDRRKNAVVLGPGLGVGQRTRDFAMAVLAGIEMESDEDEPPRSIVFDADALASFAKEPATLFAAIKESPHGVVLTPHDGEFAKLFGSLIDKSASKLERTRKAAVMSGAVIVLKGPDTVVADPDGRASIAASEAPWLATAGSGDVLAGMIGGLLAQAMPRFEAASAAVWMHADAAHRFGPGLISEDIPEMLPKVLRQLFESDLFGSA